MRQLKMVLETLEQTPFVFGKYPGLQTKQVNGAVVVAFKQFCSTFDTHDMMPLVVWSPMPGLQVAHVLIDVKVRQFDAAATMQLVELNRNIPLRHAVQV